MFLAFFEAFTRFLFRFVLIISLKIKIPDDKVNGNGFTLQNEKWYFVCLFF